MLQWLGMPAKNAYGKLHGFGIWLGDFLEARGETQGELAAKLDYARTTITNLMNGYRQPSAEFLKRFGECFPEQKNAARAEAKRHRPSAPSPEDAAWQATQDTITSHISSGELDAAQIALSDAIKGARHRSENYWLHLHQAEIARLQNDSTSYFMALLHVFDCALRLDLPAPQLASVYDKLICAAAWYSSPEYAEGMIEDLLRTTPNLAVLWYRKAALQWGKGLFASAYSALTSASQASTPSRKAIDTDLKCLRGLVLVELERYSEALDDLDRALSNPRKLPVEHLCAESARLYSAFELGTIPGKRILSEFGRLEQNTPENAWIFLYRGLCKLKMGDTMSALADMGHVSMCNKPSACSWALHKLDRARAPYNLAAALGATGETVQSSD